MRTIAGGTSLSATPQPLSDLRSVSEESAHVIPLSRGARHDTFVGQSACMQLTLEQARRIALTSAPVLITGDSGTGKEVLARLIQHASPRRDQPYVRVNCAALSETLIESELFGHERGAFTGAEQQRVGRFEWVGNGTLLLDEISEIPLKLQAKLLRVLEEEEFQRVGSNTAYPMKARVIATSNRCLSREVAEGRFREDLYHRLNVVPLELPPLRERREDIPLLIDYFLQQFRHEGDPRVCEIHEEAVAQLASHEWPGNVRQLRNVVRRICILSESSVIRVADLPDLGLSRVTPSADLFQMTIREANRLLVQAALGRYHGNRAAAARHLGITGRTLRNWLKQESTPPEPSDPAEG